MTQKKIRIDKIIDRLKEKGIIVTQTHLQDGIFPWRTVGGSGSFVITWIQNISWSFFLISSVPLIEYYSVIDAWMLHLRYKEAIIQNQKEMIMYVREWQNIRENLKSDIARYQRMLSFLIVIFRRIFTHFH